LLFIKIESFLILGEQAMQLNSMRFPANVRGLHCVVQRSGLVTEITVTEITTSNHSDINQHVDSPSLQPWRSKRRVTSGSRCEPIT